MADNLLDKASILLTPTAYNDGSMLSIKPENGDGDFTFSRGGNASRTDSSGEIVTESANIPRIDYTDGCGSWLLEPQSTNTVRYSEEFSNAEWGQVGSPTLTSGQLAPDGTLSATKISGTIGSSYIALGTASSSTATRSIYAKTVSGTGTAKLMSYHGNTNNLFTLTEEWQRFELTGTISTAGNASFYIDFRDNTQTLSEFIIWGAQSEELTYATSYIPTNGAVATRLADVATNSGNASLINSTEGVFYAEIADVSDNVNKLRFINIADISSTFTDRISIGFKQDNRILFEVLNNNSLQMQYFDNTTNVLEFNKMCVRYKNNDCAVFVNGVKVHQDTSVTIPSNLSTLIMAGFTNGTFAFEGKVKALAVYKEALTDAELQSLTTI